MILGTCFVVRYAFEDLPPITERPLVNIPSLPLFFGTALFAFTGIAVVIPLLNVMKKPERFATLFGYVVEILNLLVEFLKETLIFSNF